MKKWEIISVELSPVIWLAMCIAYAILYFAQYLPFKTNNIMEEVLTIAGKDIDDKIVDVRTGCVYTHEEYIELIKALIDE